MSKVYFMNNGDFDVRSMLTMGVSVKSNDSSIGFFGTGFKYAVAIILRLGGSIKLTTTSGVYEFTKKTENIRNKDFDIVYCNNREAGFTTHLGINWEPWMAYRELFCNAMDENGETSSTINLDYDTIIEVDCNEVNKAHYNKSTYFLNEKPIASNNVIEVYDSEKPFFYYQGVAVANAVDGCRYSYNIKQGVSLSEERMAMYVDIDILSKIRRFWQKCTDKKLIKTIVRNRNIAEGNKIDFNFAYGVSDEFISECVEAHKTTGVCESIRKLIEQYDEKTASWPEFKLNDVQSKMLEKAISFLSKIDAPVNEFEIKFVSGLGSGVMGRALDGVIYLSEMPFNMGTKQVASTLLEEWVHNKFGCADFDRQMQNYLFDKILSLGESLNGEPL